MVSTQFTTLAKVKNFLGITDSSQDTLLADLINQMGGFIETYCARTFGAADYASEIYDTNNPHRIFLRNRPVNSLSGVRYRAGTISAPVWINFDPNGYLLYAKEGYVFFYGKLPKIHQGMQFDYNAGYLVDWTHETDISKHNLPGSLTLVANEVIANVYTNRQSMGIMKQQTEGQMIQTHIGANELTKRQEAILNSFSLPYLAQ